MPVTRIHFDASHGGDAGAATILLAAPPAANAIIISSTPPPDSPSPKPTFTEPNAHLLREVTA